MAPPREPFSVSDDFADPWRRMVQENQVLQAPNYALSGDDPPGHLLSASFHGGSPNPPAPAARPTLRPTDIGYGRQADFDADRAAGDALGAVARSVGHDIASGYRAAKHWVVGQDAETPTSANPVASWAQAQVGHPGYGRLNTAQDARGQLQDHLGPARGLLAAKCNQFVWDALTAGGAQPGRLGGGRIPVAKDWGDARSEIPGYAPVSGPPQPGDVVSNGEHVGIYAPMADGSPGTVSAASGKVTDLTSPDGGLAGAVAHNQWGFRGNEGRVVFWRPIPRRAQ